MPSYSAVRKTSSSSSRISISSPVVGEDLDVEAEGLHLLDEHLEALGDARLGDVLALDDGLVDLHAAEHVVGLDGEQLLQAVGGAVGLEGPHLHLAEALAAELRLPAERLLGDHRVRAGGPGVDLVVDEVGQLQDVDVADGDRVVVGLAGAAVVERGLAVGAGSAGRRRRTSGSRPRGAGSRRSCWIVGCLPAWSSSSQWAPSNTGRGDEHRRLRCRAGLGLGAADRLVADCAAVVPAPAGRVAEVRLEHLADVHAARDAERVEDDVDRRAVGHERHVLDREDLGDDALVAVAAGELVAHADLALLARRRPAPAG